MSFRLTLAAMIAFACSPLLYAPALAANCAPLEMRLMQLQAIGAAAPEIAAARGMLAQCDGSAPATSSSWSNGNNDDQASRPASRPRNASRGGERTVESVRWRGRGNTFRTLCVRSCDGYYFPISFSTTREHLANDQAACQRMCPAGDASLYYHRLRSQGPAQMVSIDGSPYAELDNAFRYRDVLDTSCSCGTPIPADPSAEVAAPILSAAFPLNRLPMPRPALGEDPETLLNRLGSLDAARDPVLILALIKQAPKMISGPEHQVARVVLSDSTERQSRLLLSNVPSDRFRPRSYSVPRGPGEIACFRHSYSCHTE